MVALFRWLRVTRVSINQLCSRSGQPLEQSRRKAPETPWGFLNPVGPLPAPSRCQVRPTLLWMSSAPLTPLPSGQPWSQKTLTTKRKSNQDQTGSRKRPGWLSWRECFHFRARLKDTSSNCYLFVFIAYFQVLNSHSHLCFLDWGL